MISLAGLKDLRRLEQSVKDFQGPDVQASPQVKMAFKETSEPLECLEKILKLNSVQVYRWTVGTSSWEELPDTMSERTLSACGVATTTEGRKYLVVAGGEFSAADTYEMLDLETLGWAQGQFGQKCLPNLIVHLQGGGVRY